MPMPIVYVAGKFRGKTPWDVHLNVTHAETFALAVALLGASPLCPHANTAHFDKQLDDKFWLDATARLLEVSDAIVLIPGWRDSAGARNERDLADKWKKPIFYLDGFEAAKVDQNDDYGTFARWVQKQR